jgi:hypothetical protein
MVPLDSSSSFEHPKKRSLSFWIGRILIFALASIGAVTIGVICIVTGVAGLLGILSDGKPSIVSVAPSLNGRHKAMKVGRAGGGGLSPFCNYAILVGLASNVDDIAKHQTGNEVFNADCASDPEAKWLSDDTLQVSFSAMSGPHYLRNLDTSRKFRGALVKRPQHASVLT